MPPLNENVNYIDRISLIINKYSVKRSDNVPIDMPLFDDGYLDSLNALDVIEELELEFNLHFEMEDLTGENFGSIEQINQFLNSKL
jgi:acyl carrier protein